MNESSSLRLLPKCNPGAVNSTCGATRVETQPAVPSGLRLSKDEDHQAAIEYVAANWNGRTTAEFALLLLGVPIPSLLTIEKLA